MKRVSIVLIFIGVCLNVMAQPIRSASDAEPIVKQFDMALAVKQYQGSFGDSYSYILTADTVKKALLKAVVSDRHTKSTRTYYFHNEYLLKVVERFEQPSPINVSLRFFLDPDYALYVDYKDNTQKELLARQRLQNDAYKFLLQYQKMMEREE
jgi:thymidylate kinase